MSLKNLLHSIHSRLIGIDEEGALVIQTGKIRSGDGTPVSFPDGIAVDVEIDPEGLVTTVNGEEGPHVSLTQDDIPDGATNKGFTQAEKTKLAGVGIGATANMSDSYLLNRANHVGSQAQSTITGLVSDLAGKAASSHTHTASAITDFKDALFDAMDEGPNISLTRAPGTGNIIVTSALEGESGAAITSVNGDTGPAVTLNQDEIPDGTTAKQFTATEKTKLSGITPGATANDTDANLKSRANHTGTQAISTVTNLQTTLDGKAAASHTHTASQITDFNSAVDARIAASVTSVNGETGAVTLDQDDVSDGSIYKRFSGTEKTKLATVTAGATPDRAGHTGSQNMSTVTGLSSFVATRYVHPNLFTVGGYANAAALGNDADSTDGTTIAVRRVQFVKDASNVIRSCIQVLPPANWDPTQPITVMLRAFRTATGTGTKAQFQVRARANDYGSYGTNNTFLTAATNFNFTSFTGTRYMYDESESVTVDGAVPAAAGDGSPLVFIEISRDSRTANAANDDFDNMVSLIGAWVTFALT